MTAEMDPTVRELLLNVHTANPLSEARRNTLLALWEISDQIDKEVVEKFESNLCARFKEEQIECKAGDDNGLKKEAWGLIKGPRSEFIADGQRVVAYAGIQRCPPAHGTPWPHLIIGINFEGMDDGEHETELRPWRERVQRSRLGPGTRDSKWVWQEIAEGFGDLRRSKDTAIRLLNSQSADDILNRMHYVLGTFVETVRGMEQ